MLNINLSASGLDQKESIAYLALLELGEATMGELVKKSHLKRSTLYFLVDALKTRGLVSASKKNKKTLYIAESPKKLLDQADENRKSLEKVLPELLSVANNITEKPKVRYFEGVDGIREVYRDMLMYPDQKMCAWVSESMIKEFDPAFINDFYIPQRLEKKIWSEVIASDGGVGEGFKAKDITSLRKTKLMSGREFPLSIEIALYGGSRIGFMSIEDKLGLIVESKPIADTLKSIFSAQWASLKD